MVSRVGLVTTDDDFLQGADVEIAPMCHMLNDRGVAADILIWHDQTVRWEEYNLLIFRSPWDYSERASEFLDWLDMVERSVRALNAPALVRWNFDKRYLGDLQAHSAIRVDVVFCHTIQAVKEAIRTLTSEMVVIKPNISAGSHDTGLFAVSDIKSTLALAELIFSQEKIVLVQPAIQTIQHGAERGLVYLNGVFSHAIRKGPILAPGGGYLGGTYSADISRVEVSSDEIDLGNQVLAAIRSIASERNWGSDALLPLYARIDVATDVDGTTKLIEAELFEPSLYLRADSSSMSRFIEAIMNRLN